MMGRGAPDWQPWRAIQRYEKTGGTTIYAFNVSTPAGRAEGNPLWTPLVLEKGFISEVSLRFPPGSMGQLYVSLWSNGEQIWPATADSWFRGNDIVIPFPVEQDIPLVNGDYKLDCKSYNDDSTYPHLVLIRTHVVRLP